MTQDICPPKPAAPSSSKYRQDGRRTLSRIHALLTEAPELKPAYRQAREVIRLFQTSGFYEITSRCNLHCEGCYFFHDGQGGGAAEETDIQAWARHFEAERRRGVSMGYFVGAEPALEQDRLLAASEHIPYGNIGTNGTIRIDPAVPYRIQISVWGGDTLDGILRGGSVFRKALRNYQGDSRAIALYTFNRRNIGDAREVVAACRDHGIGVTFNMYAPTGDYLSKLANAVPQDGRFFRTSRADDNLILTSADHASIRTTVDALIDEFPDHVLYSKSYNRFITAPESPYEIDAATGIAENCRSRVRGSLRYYTPALEPAAVKCCTPEIDCASCRLYSGGWAGRLEPRAEDVIDVGAFREWLDMVGTLERIFVNRVAGELAGHP